MDEEIREGKYIESGEFNGNLYGTKLDSIHNVTMDGKMCVLDVNPTVSSIEMHCCYINFIISHCLILSMLLPYNNSVLDIYVKYFNIRKRVR